MFSVIVMTSDKYLFALPAFAYLFNKYWGYEQQVKVYGFTTPSFRLPENFSFHSLGKFEDFPVNRWSDALLLALEREKNSHVVLFLEDYFLCRKADVEGVHILARYARENQNVLKIDLCADRLYAKDAQSAGYFDRFDLVKSHPKSPYHMSLMCGLWNVELLKKVLIPGETPWDIEIAGTTRLSRMGDSVLVFGTRQWPVRHTLAFRGLDISKPLLSELNPMDILTVSTILSTHRRT